MNRKTIIIGITSVFIFLIGGLAYLTFGKIQHQEQVTETIQTFPTILAWSTDSTAFRYHPDMTRPTVIIYFNSECSLCQHEAAEIKAHYSDLQEANILMISSESLVAIRTFGKTYQLDQYENIQLAQMDPVAVTETFGAISVPTILIYNRQQQLVKQYRGETKIEAIAAYL